MRWMGNKVAKKIKITRGKCAIVDDADYAMVNFFKWQLHSNPHGRCYARTSFFKRRKTSQILMHVFIMGKKQGLMLDHINGNGLDNRRSNLRYCTANENQQNKGLRKDNKTGFKGVHIEASTKYFIAQMNINGKRTHIGRFKTAKQAAKAYDKKCKEMYGEFYKPNTYK